MMNAHSHTIRVVVHLNCAPNYIKNLYLSGVGPDGCMHVEMDVGEREDVIVSPKE